MQSMNLTKLSAAIILALSTAACSSGGSHSTTSTSPVITEQTAAEKAAAEKAAAEKAAAEKAAAEKAAAEKAAAEKAAAEKAAAEKAAAEKAAAEKAAAEKAAAEKAAAEKAAAEKAAAEKAAAEKAEADRLAAEIYQAKGGQYYSSEGEIVTKDTGSSSSASREVVTTPSGSYYANVVKSTSSKSIIYNQPYSVVLGDYTNTSTTINGSNSVTDNLVININGLRTALDAIPTLGTASYSGKAFDKNQQGTLSYNVDFTKKTGVGSIIGLGDTIELQQGSIVGNQISATAVQSKNTGNYNLGFYGKKAEEIAGKVIFNGKDTVGFGGTRGEITK